MTDELQQALKEVVIARANLVHALKMVSYLKDEADKPSKEDADLLRQALRPLDA